MSILSRVAPCTSFQLFVYWFCPGRESGIPGLQGRYELTMRDLDKIAAVIALATFVFAGVGMAQEITGTIQGLVTDTSGSKVPNARVNIRNVGTNTQRNFTTG